MGKTVQEENRLDTEGTESYILFPQRCRLSSAGALKHRTQNQRNGSDKDKTAQPEEPSPAKLRAIIEANTCPKIPAAKNAVDIAPIARARPAGSTDSVRYARATGANPAAVIPWQVRRIASIPSVGAKAHPKVARVSTLRERTTTFFVRNDPKPVPI